MYATYFVPQNNAPRLKEKLEKLSRKAVRLGCAAIMVAVAKVFSAPHPDRDRARNGERLVYEALTIQGEPPKLNGWVFAATLDHETGKDGRPVNLLRCHGEETLPHKYRTATPDNCDHCHTNRRRNNTFVVRHEESGEWKQVGRSCLKDFLGTHKDPGAMARLAAQLLELDRLVREESEEGWGCGGERVLDLNTYLAWVVCSIEGCGWLSRTAARERDNDVATADTVWNYLTSKTKQNPADWGMKEPTEATYQEVREALAWVMEQDASENDYYHNLQTIVELEAVRYHTAGYAASIVSSFRGAKERELRREVLSAGGDSWVGTPGKRQDLRLTLLGTHQFEGYYGTTYLHRFADTDGNSVVWWASNYQVVEYPGDQDWDAGYYTTNRKGESVVMVPMVVGATYKVKATVKEHGTYRGEKQTKVSRLVVQPLTKPKKQRKQRVRKAS